MVVGNGAGHGGCFGCAPPCAGCNAAISKVGQFVVDYFKVFAAYSYAKIVVAAKSHEFEGVVGDLCVCRTRGDNSVAVALGEQ